LSNQAILLVEERDAPAAAALCTRHNTGNLWHVAPVAVIDVALNAGAAITALNGAAGCIGRL